MCKDFIVTYNLDVDKLNGAQKVFLSPPNDKSTANKKWKPVPNNAEYNVT